MIRYSCPDIMGIQVPFLWQISIPDMQGFLTYLYVYNGGAIGRYVDQYVMGSDNGSGS